VSVISDISKDSNILIFQV